MAYQKARWKPKDVTIESYKKIFFSKICSVRGFRLKKKRTIFFVWLHYQIPYHKSPKMSKGYAEQIWILNKIGIVHRFGEKEMLILYIPKKNNFKQKTYLGMYFEMKKVNLKIVRIIGRVKIRRGKTSKLLTKMCTGKFFSKTAEENNILI